MTMVVKIIETKKITEEVGIVDVSDIAVLVLIETFVVEMAEKAASHFTKPGVDTTWPISFPFRCRTFVL